MKAGDVSVVQYDTEHGGLRVLPLRTVADIGRNELLAARPHDWIVVGYAADEAQAYGLMKAFRRQIKGAERPATTK